MNKENVEVTEKKVENPVSEQEKNKEKKKKKEHHSNKEIEKLKEEITSQNEKILRLSAEMQNMRRRADEERSKLLKYDGEAIIMNMLTILDNFEHAINMDDTNLTDEVSKFLSGFKMIYANMSDSLKSIGVTEIECLHEPFDEAKMNAVLIDHSKDFENNVVLDVLQKGYMYKDKVIRPAMVKVNQVEEGGTSE